MVGFAPSVTETKQGRPTLARVVVAAGDVIQVDVDFFKTVGFRLINIYPSDKPEFANMEGHGMQLTLRRGDTARPTIVLTSEDCDALAAAAGGADLTSPSGVPVRIESYARYDVKVVEPVPAFEVRQLDGAGQSPWSVGRAGMLYRDLIPSRLGGGIVASHIRIEEGGLVPDFVHFHDIGFQLIFCVNGWVRLVYEDQGEPFVLRAGDCVTQPPRIRHRVLESSDMLEVVEIGVPDEHMTTLDWTMPLPNGPANPAREFDGQTFCHFESGGAAPWEPWRLPGFEQRDTGVGACTRGAAGVRVVRRGAGFTAGEGRVSRHTADIHFTFVRSGCLELEAEGHGTHTLSKGSAVTVPPGLETRIVAASEDLEMIEVSLDAVFETTY